MIKTKDHGADALLKRLKKFPRVKVGVIGTEASAKHRTTGTTVAEIATIHEYGLGVPKRSFIRDYVDQNMPAINTVLRATGAGIIRGEDPIKAANALGAHFVGEIQDRISDHIPPPLSQETIDRKGSDTPLIDTGQLRSSITYAVEGEK